MNPGNNTPKKPENRPGLPEIAYRISNYASFRRRLLSLLPSILPSQETSKSAPLAKLTTRLDDDPAIALLDAWAIVAEVLTFYQERIANEGYLRTATERLSVLELARAIGYELKPGVAASTFLTFTVEDAPGSPKEATIPKGTQIMSVPGKDELPQTFETTEEFTAHVDWNIIKPRPSRPQNITINTRQLYLNGISNQLKAGDYLLLVDEEPEIHTYLLPITDVKEDTQAGYTLVKWEEYLNPPETPLRNPKVFAFRQKANLFGYNAPAWEDMTAEVKLAAIEAKNVSVQWGVFKSSDNGTEWQSVSKGLPNADILCLTIWDGILFAGTAGKGIYRSKDNGNNWEPVNNGLTNLNIQTLYTNPENSRNPLFAGTPGGGVFRSKDGGETWVPINIGSVKIQQITPQTNENSQANLVSINTSLPNTIVRSVLTYNDYIFVGTDDGIFLSTNQGKDWEAKNLSNRTVYSLLIEPDCFIGTAKIKSSSEATITVSDTKFSRSPQVGDVIRAGKKVRKIVEISGTDKYSFILDAEFDSSVTVGTTIFYLGKRLFAGTDRGVYCSPDFGNSWNECKNTALDQKTVYSLVSYRSNANKNFIFAGTNTGVYRSLNCGDSWEVINDSTLSGCTVYSLATYEYSGNRYLFAATNKGIFFSTNSNAESGVNWTLVDRNLSTQNFTALALKTLPTQKKIFAGSKFAGFISSAVTTDDTTDGIERRRREEIRDWPGFQITDPKLIDFDTLYPQVLKDSWFVVFDDRNSESDQKKDTPKFFASKVENISTISRRDFGLNAKITRIQLNTPVNPKYFGLRSAIALVRSEELELAKELLTVSDRQQEIFQDPIQDKTILLNDFVQGLQPNQTLIVSGQRIRIQLRKDLELVNDFSNKSVKGGEVLQLLEPPLVQDSQTRWKLMDKDGFQGDLTTVSSEDITLLSAGEDSEFVGEVVQIQSPPTDQQKPVLTLQEPLKNAYDPTTVKIYANVVQATHGETIEEVLGSGDGNITNQRFTLKKPPLTYVSRKTASGADSTLEVRVNGVLWQEVPSLYSLTAQDQSYMIRIENDGTTSVTFGDGIQGSRLPTGEENITATYRSGIGLDGNLGVDRLSLLKTRPLGILEVTNPVPATGASAPESLEEARTKAPSTVRTLDRIVSLSDFEDFVRGFAGIGKAQAVELWHEETQLVHITIAAVNGAEVLRESNLYTNLIEAIDLARDPLQKVQVDSYDRLLFNLEAKLLLDRRYEAEAIKNKVHTALNSNFAFDRRQFAQAVTASEVVAIIQNIEGIVAVDLDALYQVGSSKALEQSLTALPARSDPLNNQVHPAQLLLLNPAGIQLTIVPTL
ncbi:putative baseplate assembly protein [Capilliphycus salinus ALCB114379]|uniref:putative baseplate assembly protein n=1 Tax=Capilliphycus salinus TaxID=2768948 RepID=UPI0039A47A3C